MISISACTYGMLCLGTCVCLMDSFCSIDTHSRASVHICILSNKTRSSQLGVGRYVCTDMSQQCRIATATP